MTSTSSQLKKKGRSTWKELCKNTYFPIYLEKTNVFVALIIADDLVEAIPIRGKVRFCRLKLENIRKEMLKHISLISVPTLVLEITTPTHKTHASFTCQMKPQCLGKKKFSF